MTKLELIATMCKASSYELDCHGLNNLSLAHDLLALCNVFYDAIVEIPLSWSNQVGIVYVCGKDCFEFCCGLSCKDGKYFELINKA